MSRQDSQGTYLKVGDGASPEVFSTIGEIADMPPIEVSKSDRDRTGYDDTVRQHAHGIEEPGSFTLTMYWDPDDTQQNGLITAYTGESDDNYKVVCPDSPATEFSFSAKVMGYSTPYAGIDADLQWDVTFQLTSTITKA